MKPLELKGPTGVRPWSESYRILITGLIGVGAVSMGPYWITPRRSWGTNDSSGPALGA